MKRDYGPRCLLGEVSYGHSAAAVTAPFPQSVTQKKVERLGGKKAERTRKKKRGGQERKKEEKEKRQKEKKEGGGWV